jgi:MFS family permease
MAATAGLVVANIYYNQPILNNIAATFEVGPAAVAWLSTATQLGYAAGLLFVVPLGDGVDRKWLIIGSTLVSSAILIILPVSPNLPSILGASFALGFASVAPQLTASIRNRTGPKREMPSHGSSCTAAKRWKQLREI